MNQTKVCTRCNVEKEWNLFPYQKNGKYNISSWCKQCHNEYKRIQYQTNPDIRRKQKEYREANKDRNKDYKKAYDKSYNETHKMQLAKQKKVYRQENKLYLKRAKQLDYVNNRDKINERSRQWRIDNRDRYNIWYSQRRAQKRNSPGKFTYKDWLAVLDRNNYSCFYCNITEKQLELKGEGLVIEHLIPLCKGGYHNIKNIECACKTCNSDKGTMTLEEYIDFCLIYSLKSERTISTRRINYRNKEEVYGVKTSNIRKKTQKLTASEENDIMFLEELTDLLGDD